jgi:flagellar biosynthesis protein FlhB
MADKSQQTEKATPHRIEQARREGRFAVSREAVGALQFATFAALLAWLGGGYCSRIMESTRYLFRTAFTAEITAAELLRISRLLLLRDFLPLGLAGGMLLAVSLGAQLATTRFGISSKGLTPNFKRLNFLTRLRELPRQNIPLFVQAVVLLPLFAGAVYGVVKDNWSALLAMPFQAVEKSSLQMAVSIQGLIWKGAMVFIVMGAIDFVRQNRRYMADLRMSKQELREEVKEMEGNPQVRARVRQLRREWLRRRMMSQVPSATAVIVNPTHYAVAIRYAMDSMSAPTVVAKGKNYLALRIRKKAVEHQVPIVENPPLAQALYKSADVGQEIPAHLYRAVAEILAYIYRIMGGRLPA